MTTRKPTRARALDAIAEIEQILRDLRAILLANRSDPDHETMALLGNAADALDEACCAERIVGPA